MLLLPTKENAFGQSIVVLLFSLPFKIGLLCAKPASLSDRDDTARASRAN
jgi:hypothetical protein